MHEPIKEAIGRWSLERLGFMLAHIEDFIDDEEKLLKERAKNFVAEGGLDKIQSLLTCEPSDPQLPRRLLDRLCAFFEAGLLMQKGPSPESASWWVTDVFWRGNLFHLDIHDQVQANSLVPEVPPLQVHRAPATRMLEKVRMQFLAQNAGDADAYLLKPTPMHAYALICTLAAPWSVDHIAHAHRLVNKCFIY